jgi:cellulose synthase/poly-beta-1,6-N-acetylglucosamine synthase-like glycosyltransferase
MTALAERIEDLPIEPDIEVLPARLSARRLLSRGQLITLGAIVIGAIAGALAHLAVGVGPSIVVWGQLLMGAVTTVYAMVIAFKAFVMVAGWGHNVIGFENADPRAVSNRDLPVYTVLVPLYREGEVLAALVERLHGLDYPADRLQILLLVEGDDPETISALATIDLGPQFEVVLIPPSQPRTKPKALNIGLAKARGDFCVIFDAEDHPEPGQLRKAVTAFRQLPDWVVCIQAELQYWNPWTNWLTRCFAAEYAVNFSLVLRGLDRFRLPIPLGGTSNHFRTDALRQLGGWDPYNVTEDADLGMRIARKGWRVRMFQSVTEEEANSELRNWVRQRSRWIKGYLQTWLVHMRSPVGLWRDLGPRQFLSFQLTLGFFTITTLVNPLVWLLTAIYLISGPSMIEALFPPVTLYVGLACMAIGNLMMIYVLMVGCMERELYRGVRAMLTVPAYWALMSVAAYKAVGQLLLPRRRHYWELTQHGLVDEPAVQ